MIDWEWNGPPGDAPGGTLTWSNDFDGGAYAYGDNNVTSGSAVAASDAKSDTGSEGTEGSGWGFGEVWGSVENEEMGKGDWDGNGSEDYSHGYPTINRVIASYSFGLEWSLNSIDIQEDIPPLTTYVYFGGGIGSDSAATANAYGNAKSNGYSDSNVQGSFSADFSSN